MKSNFAVLICAVALAMAADDQFLKIKTTNGEVKGFVRKSCRGLTPFVSFRGIPYAEPPVGNLRFKDPVPKQVWPSIWDATFERPSCLQGSMDGSKSDFPGVTGVSEDCLYLNVHTPNLRYLQTKLAPLKPVMVFIHMGAFMMGSGAESVISPDFLVDQDVVLVTFNYRLGALGFLSLQNEEVPGNAGLKDQNLALKWVKKNIKAFGGDPNKITIFGESAGSASVNYHLLSKSSAGLFNRAIMESGTALTPWAFSPPELSLKKSINLAKKVGCPDKEMSKLLQCLQKIPAERIRDSQQKTITLEELLSLRVVAFHPTTEPDVPGAFITDSPFDLMYSGNFTKVPSIIGSTSDEGLMMYPALKENDPNGVLLGLIGMDLSRFAPYNFHVMPFTKIAFEVHQMISQFYFNGNPLRKEMLGNVLELLTDTMFVLPIQLTASLIAETSTPVYNYFFTYDGLYGMGKASANIMDVPGVCHGDEVGYLFYIPDLHVYCGRNATMNVDSAELMINRMTKMWANFAKTGNPTPKPDREVPITWKPFTSKERNFLDIGEDLVPSDSIKLGNMIFWEALIKKLIANQSGNFRQLEDSL